MKIIRPKNTMQVAVERGRNCIHLDANHSYIMHEVEVESGKRAGAFEHVTSLPDRPNRFQPGSNLAGRMILPFIGGMGDVISMLPVIAYLHRHHPEVTIDVAATPGPGEIWSLCPLIESVLPYPLTDKAWQTYDGYLTMEVVQETGQAPGRSLPDVFAAALGLELAEYEFPLNVSSLEGMLRKHPGNRGAREVGIVVGNGQSNRWLPRDLILTMLRLLGTRRSHCTLLGHADNDWPMPTGHHITDLRSKTESVTELAARLLQLDAVITPDSFIMHLAGALAVPTVACFTASSASHADPYRHVKALISHRSCAPCHGAVGNCPEGFTGCPAWDDQSFKPQVVIDAVKAVIRQRGIAAIHTMA